jgi:hypothetical protein
MVNDGEVPIASDFITSALNPSMDLAKLKLGTLGTPAAGDVILYIQAKKT